LISGFVSFASPCSLPILPAYIAYSFKSSKKNIKAMTIFFFLGLSLVFTFIGMSTTAVGLFLKNNIMLFSQIAGISIILFGIYILIGGGFSGFKIKQKKPTSYIGSFLFGSILGISWTPCVGPILIALLLVASTVGSVAKGGILLFFYSVGLALPLILVSVYIERLDKKSKIWKMIQGKEIKIFGKKIHSTTLISGLLFVILGYLIFSGSLYSLSQSIGTSGLQNSIFDIEETLLKLIK
jgi:cytochrome c-type biogenesis protein